LLSGVEHGGEAASLLAMLEGADRAWLIDAARSGAPAGTIHRIDCCSGRVPSRADVSSHGFGVAQAIELGRALGTLPRQCLLYAIEAADFTDGAPLSPGVERAVHEVAERIRAELIQPPL
jgi:hydrogenase maturation protease